MHKRERPPRQAADWMAILQQALNEPGVANRAYHLFHRFSLGNSLWAALQIEGRGLPLGPIASFKKWQDLGRQVRKGEKGISLLMPVIVGGKKKRKDAQPDTDAPAAWLVGSGSEPTKGDAEPQAGRRIFVERAHWFTLAQTDPIEGVEPNPAAQAEPDAIEFVPDRAIEKLGFRREPFRHTDGNKMGYSYPSEGVLAVSDLATDPTKTLIHEMAHCLLHTDSEAIVEGRTLPRAIIEVEAECVAYLVCATIGHMASAAHMRDYIQSWLSLSSEGSDVFTKKNASRVFSAANKIIQAGTELDEVEEVQRAAA